MFHQDIKVISELLLRNFLLMTQITNISKKSGNLNRGSTNVKKSEKPQELSHCWWECTMLQLRWKTVWRFLAKLTYSCQMIQQSSFLVFTQRS